MVFIIITIYLLWNTDLSNQSRSVQDIYIFYHGQKINKEIITFGDIEIEKRRLHYHKNPILIDSLDIDKILIPSKVSSGEKKNINILLVTKMMITKFSHCV